MHAAGPRYVALLMQLIGILPGLGGLDPYLANTRLSAWQGLFRGAHRREPIIRGLWVSGAYAPPARAAAHLVLLRRDVAGG